MRTLTTTAIALATVVMTIGVRGRVAGTPSTEAVPLVAAQNGAAVFQRLAGEWRGEGTLMDRSARFDMRWDLRGRFAMLTFANAFVDATGRTTPVLESAAIYRTSSDAPEAVWLDSRGERIEITWMATDSTLIADWTAPTEAGRTTYRIVSAEGLEVVDEVMRDGSLVTFATARYERATGDPR